MLIFSSVWLCWLAWTTVTFDMKIVYFLVISLTDCTLQNDFGFLTTVTFRFISNVICLQCGFWLYVAQSTCVGCLLSETSVWLNLNEEWYEHHKSAEEVCNEAVYLALDYRLTHSLRRTRSGFRSLWKPEQYGDLGNRGNSASLCSLRDQSKVSSTTLSTPLSSTTAEICYSYSLRLRPEALL